MICTAGESIPTRVHDLTQGVGVRYALDAVGGPTGTAVIQALASGGCLLVYGTLSGEPLALDSRTLMVGGKSIRGFWLSDWAARQKILTMLSLFRTIQNLLRAGILTSEVGQVSTLDEVRQAVIEAAKAGRKGKVLLRISER